jgi:hypothetical protein
MVFGSKDRDSRRQSTETRADVAGTLRESAGSLGEIVLAADRAVAELRTAVDASGDADARPGGLDRAALERELARTLLERAEGLQREAKDLAGILDRASARLTKADGAHPREARSTPFARRTEGRPFARRPKPAPGPDATGDSPASKSGSRAPKGVRLLATQMAVAGSSPKEIAARLQSEFGVDNAQAVVADALSVGDQEG